MISSSGDDIRKRMEIWQDILKVFFGIHGYGFVINCIFKYFVLII